MPSQGFNVITFALSKSAKRSVSYTGDYDIFFKLNFNGLKLCSKHQEIHFIFFNSWSSTFANITKCYLEFYQK